MRVLSVLVLLVAALVTLSRASFGSPPAVLGGTLSVKTVNATGQAVSGALVNVFPAGSSTPAATGTTNHDGKVGFSGLAAGNYTVSASKVGLVNGIPTAIFGTASATVGSLPAAVTVKLVKNAP